MSRSYIKLIVSRPDGSRSTATIAGDNVTPPMIDAANDLLATVTTGERSLPKDLYDAMATAFDVSRAKAKRQFLRAVYGGKKRTSCG
jgi:hypothetical protein